LSLWFGKFWGIFKVFLGSLFCIYRLKILIKFFYFKFLNSNSTKTRYTPFFIKINNNNNNNIYYYYYLNLERNMFKLSDLDMCYVMWLVVVVAFIFFN
jgi:hypothetical protein